MLRKLNRVTLLALALALAPAAGGARAEVSDAVGKQVRQAISTFVTEWATYLNCSALDPAHGKLRESYEDEVTKSAELLVVNKLPEEALSQFRARTSYDAVMKLDGKLSEIMAYCAENEGWLEKVVNFDMYLLSRELEKIFGI